MPQLSHKAAAMPPSPIRKLVPYAEGAKSRGTKVYHLNIGQPDIPTPPQYLEAVAREASSMKVLEYSHSAGNLSLRKKIADYYGRKGYGIDSEQVLVTTGGSEALNFVLASCLNPGDEVIIPEPFYANYNGFATAFDIKVVPIPTRIDEDFALPSMEAFEERITPRTRAILICNPGNPTGILYPEAALAKLRDIVLKHNLFLIADEVYREFAYDGLTHYSVLGLAGLEEHAIVVDSISKRFSACGARIGCIVSRNKELMTAALKFAQARLSPPTFGQIGAEAVYDLPQSFYDGVVTEYVHRRDVLMEELSTIPGVLCARPTGAFYAMVRLPVADTDVFCQWMLERFSYNGATVMMAPASGFYSTPGLGKDEVRIAYVLNADDLRAAIACLKAGLEAYAKEVK